MNVKASNEIHNNQRARIPSNRNIEDARKMLIYELMQAREKMNMSQTKLAALTGVDQANLSKIESGKVVPSLDTFLRLLEPLEKTLVVALGRFRQGAVAKESNRPESMLKDSELFIGISETGVKKVFDAVPYNVISFAAGEVIARSDDTLVNLCILLDGMISSQTMYTNAKERINRYYEPGEIVGLSIVASKTQHSPYSFTAVDDCRLLLFDWSPFISGEKIPPELHEKLLKNILSSITNDVLKRDVRIDVLSARSVRERVLTFLITMSEKRGDKTIDIKMKQPEFARYLCVDRTSLASELSAMRSEGVIGYKGTKYTLL